VKNIEYEVIGNLDADVSLDEDHFEFLLGKFREDSHLGVAGTVFREPGYNSETDSFEGRTTFPPVSDFPAPVLRGNWRLIFQAKPEALTDSGQNCPNDRLEDKIISREIFLSSSVLGTAERGVLASSFAYGKKDYILGAILCGSLQVCLSNDKEALSGGRHGAICGVRRGLIEPHRTASLRRTHGIHRREQMVKLKAYSVHLQI